MTTITDRIIPFYVWFTLGFSILAIAFGAINFVVNIWTLLTVKGINITTWQISIFGIIVFSACIFLGWSFEYYKLWDRIISHQNQNMNPEIRQVAKDVQEINPKIQEITDDIKTIKKMLEERE